MTRVCRALTHDEILPFIRIVALAYPSMKVTSEEDIQRFAERIVARMDAPIDTLHGLFEDNTLLGGMRLIDFQTNVRGATLLIGGVGLVAVDFLHKKEQVARDMIQYYLQLYQAKGAPLAALYPFRPDFYMQMGFGYGAKESQYSFTPASLPPGRSKAGVTFLTEVDTEAAGACYERVQRSTHGMMQKLPRELERLIAAPDQRVVGYRAEGQLQGYLAFSFDADPGGNFIRNNLHMREFIYETREALAALLAFLRTQADQIERIVIETQDETFHHLLSDPRDPSNRMFPHVYHQSNTQGVGLMYRVLDTAALFDALAETNFGGQTCALTLTVRDSFFPANNGSTTLRFEDGRVRRGPDATSEAAPDVEVTLDVAEFSSLIMGAVDLQTLYLYGLADVSDTRYLDTLTRLFALPRKPVCTTAF